jgi:hypothetical protein
MLKVQLFSYQWLQFPLSIRSELVKIFSIPRTGRAVVVSYGHSSDVQADGYTDKDLSAVTLEKINEYLKIEESDFNTALTKLIEILNERTNKITNSTEGFTNKEQVKGGNSDGDANAATSEGASGSIQETTGPSNGVVGNNPKRNKRQKVS